MPKDFPRARRVADALQRELSDLIRRELKDPAVGACTITAVEVSNDLSHAKVYVCTWLGPERGAETVAALARASGFLRQQLGKRLRLFKVPQLHFLYDTAIDRGVALTQLIDQVAGGAASSGRHEDTCGHEGHDDGGSDDGGA